MEQLFEIEMDDGQVRFTADGRIPVSESIQLLHAKIGDSPHCMVQLESYHWMYGYYHLSLKF